MVSSDVAAWWVCPCIFRSTNKIYRYLHFTQLFLYIFYITMYNKTIIDHFTVVGLVTWPLNGSEARVDLVLIKTSLLLLCKSSCSYAN